MKEKTCLQMTGSERYHLLTAFRVINSKIIEDEAIYNFWQFLVEDFFLLVVKPLEFTLIINN